MTGSVDELAAAPFTERPTISVVDPTPAASVRSRPLGAERVAIGGGLWSQRQEINRASSLVAAVDRLEAAGNLHNLRLVAGRASGDYRLPDQLPLPFLDSDVYKWLEAVGWELGRARSTELERLADEVIELVEAAQDEHGYVNSYWTIVEPERRWQDLANGHELYCAGHLIQAAVAHARARGHDRLLGVARRFADHLVDLFGPGQSPGVPGHPEVEMALVELARLTGEIRYLELALRFVDDRGHGHAGPHRFGPTYFQDHQPVRQATTVVGHAVRALYLEAGIVDVATETGDRELLEMSVRRWESMVATKLALTGGAGSRHQDEAFGPPFELPPDRAYNETCAAIASIMWSWRLLLATGEPRYADLIERTLYNAFLPGVSLDGQRYFYVNTLHARRDPDLEGVSTATWGQHERVPWFGCACCPPNVMRLLATLEHHIATVTEDGLQLHQYAGSRLRAPHPDGELTVEVHTDYPWDGRIVVRVVDAPSVRAGDATPWSISLRVPGWCDEATLAVNGRPWGDRPTRPGMIDVRRRWSVGDEIVLDLAMPPRRTYPHPRHDAARGTVAIERGPLVYCVESADIPEHIDLEELVLPDDPPLTVVDEPGLLGGVRTVETTATVRPAPAQTGFRYGPEDATQRPDREHVTVRAVPYLVWGNREPGGMRVWLPRT